MYERLPKLRPSRLFLYLEVNLVHIIQTLLNWPLDLICLILWKSQNLSYYCRYDNCPVQLSSIEDTNSLHESYKTYTWHYGNMWEIYIPPFHGDLLWWTRATKSCLIRCLANGTIYMYIFQFYLVSRTEKGMIRDSKAITCHYHWAFPKSQ